MIRQIIKLWRNEDGIAAVEMAMVTPILLLMLVSTIDYGAFIFDRSNMQAAGRSGIQYFMAGGSDPTQAQALVLQSWPDKPSDGKVSVVKQCICATALANCFENCPDQSPPEIHYDIVMNGTIDAILLEDRNIQSTQSVRVR